jgi:hypothetical protein
MDKNKAIKIFEKAWEYCKKNHPDELDWAKNISPDTFKNLKLKRFLTEYCWVVYASGFKVSTLEEKFYDLKKAFKNFDLNSLVKMRDLRHILAVFNNERKANCFLRGCKMISQQGFSSFKKQLREKGIDFFEQLPGIGPITKYHLAKNIGFLDNPKPDIWLRRVAKECSTSVNELVEFLSKKYHISNHVVDIVLWRFGSDNKGFV